MNVKALLKEFFGTEDFKRSRKVAKVRAGRVGEVKDRIAGFLRGDETLQAFAAAVRGAVDETAVLDGSPAATPVWGFGGPGTALFVTALLRAAPEAKIEAELRRALAGIDVRDPSDRLRTFAAFIARTARDANLGPESNLHVGYATCFLSFCWHALYDLEIPVFYGASHRGVKALLGAGLLQDPEYGSRDLAERFRAFLRITRGLNDLVRKVNPQLNFWTVEAFLEWAAPRYEGQQVGSGAGSVSSVMQAIDAGGGAGAKARTAAERPAGGSGLSSAGIVAPEPAGAGFGTMAAMNPLAAEPPAPSSAPGAGAPPPEPAKVTIGAPSSEGAPGASREETRKLDTRTHLKVPSKLMQAMGEEPRSERASPVGSATVTDERPWYSGGVRRPDEPAPPPPAEPTLDPSALPEVEAHKSAPVRLGKLGGDSGERPAAGSASGELREETRKKAALPGSGSGSGSARIGTLAAAAGPGSPAKPADADAPATEGLAELARETGFPEALLRELDTLLARRGQVVIEGPTGTGKTHLARRFAALFAGSMDRVRFIQVHPALRYEDFMEAPGANGAGSVAGVFKSFALRAAGDPGRRYVVVLDELGRADVAATLGEAYSLLEFRSEEAVLPYSREAFSIPRNLAVLATASTTTAARSLADPSARRRFHFLQLDPSAEILRGFLARVRPEYAWVADLFGELNRRLAKDGGPAAQLGQSIFMQPGLDERELERIFQFDVRPLAERAVRDPARLAELDLAALRAAVGAPAGAPRG